MKVLKSWLEDYVNINLSDEELSDKLSLTGTNIEAIIRQFDNNIVVGEIKQVDPHPNADRLQIAKVFNGVEDLQIVCGAPNIAVGQKVPLALIGTKIQDFEIKRAEIRGIESFGMMCSERELGLGDAHDGIKILPNDFIVGKSLNNYFTGDSVFEIEITPNRGDSLSHLGVAREIAVVTNQELKLPDKIELKSEESKALGVLIEATDLCSQYSAIVIKGIKVGLSPDWLQKRLIAMGARPINNIVDITNYILLDWGQPLHAFDLNKIAENKIIVRRAGEFEKIETLDSQIRNAPNESLVISDPEKLIAIAGVMGAKNSEVDNGTVDIVIESAEFDTASVRKTSKVLGLSTEASYRFERGIDSGRVFESAKYAAKLITEIAGGQIEQIIFEGSQSEQNKIKIEYNKICDLLGLDLKENQINEILSNLGFEINDSQASIPLWRHDISIWQDLAEEVGRVYGYEKIKPLEIEPSLIHEESDFYKKEYLKQILVELGFSETVNYVFLSGSDLQTSKIESGSLLEIKNPMQIENKYLRNSLISGLLKNIAKNPSFDPILLFEFGHVFTKTDERVMIGLATSGKNAKTEIEKASGALRDMLDFQSKIEVRELTREQLSQYKIRKPVSYIAEIDITNSMEKVDLTGRIKTLCGRETSFSYRQVSKYPPIVRDLAFIVDRSVDTTEVKKTILLLSNQILIVDLFDEFESAKLGQNKKSIAYHVYIQDLNKALNDSEGESIVNKINEQILSEYKAELRS